MKKRVTGRDAQNPSEQVTTTWGRRGEGRGSGVTGLGSVSVWVGV